MDEKIFRCPSCGETVIVLAGMSVTARLQRKSGSTVEWESYSGVDDFTIFGPCPACRARISAVLGDEVSIESCRPLGSYAV